MVRGSITYIHSTFCQEFMSFIEGVLSRECPHYNGNSMKLHLLPTYQHEVGLNFFFPVGFCCSKEDKVRFHTSSVLSPSPNVAGGSQTDRHKHAIKQLPTDWLVYEEMTRAHRLAQVCCSTAISPITVAIFAGPAKQSFDNIREAEGISHSRCIFSNVWSSGKQSVAPLF